MEAEPLADFGGFPPTRFDRNQRRAPTCKWHVLVKRQELQCCLAEGHEEPHLTYGEAFAQSRNMEPPRFDMPNNAPVELLVPGAKKIVSRPLQPSDWYEGSMRSEALSENVRFASRGQRVPRRQNSTVWG